MAFKPLFGTGTHSFLHSALINAIIIGIIAGLTIELRTFLDDHHLTEDLPRVPHKAIVAIITGSVIGITTFLVFRLLFGFGDSLIDGKAKKFF